MLILAKRRIRRGMLSRRCCCPGGNPLDVICGGCNAGTSVVVTWTAGSGYGTACTSPAGGSVTMPGAGAGGFGWSSPSDPGAVLGCLCPIVYPPTNCSLSLLFSMGCSGGHWQLDASIYNSNTLGFICNTLYPLSAAASYSCTGNHVSIVWNVSATDACFHNLVGSFTISP